MSSIAYVVVSTALGVAVGRSMRAQVARFGVAVPAGRPVLEIVCGALFALVALRYEETWRIIPVLVLVAACVALATVDFARYRLPNAILFPALAVSAAVIVVGELVDGEASRIVQVAIGAAVYSAILLVVHLLNPAGLGFGDVKLALLLGGFLGWVSDGRLDSVRAVMIGLLIGSVLGVVLGAARMLAVRLGHDFLPDPLPSRDRAWHKTTFPFGPPLMAGAIVVVLWPATFMG